MSNRTEIYAVVAGLSRPCQLPELWSELPALASFIHPPLDAAGLLAELQSRFSVADLQAAGLVATDPGGTAALRAPWADSTAVLFAARRAEGAAPFALVSDELDERRWPLPAVLADHQAQQQAEAFENRVFIVPTMADAAVMGCLGFPAAPAQGLADLKRARLAEFGKAINLDASRHAGAKRRGLVLVPWSAARLDAADAPQIEAVGRHLVKLYRSLSQQLAVDIWRLEERQLEDLRFCAMHLDAAHIRAAALASYEAETGEFIAPRPPRPPAKPHHQALREWLDVGQTPIASAERREQAWGELVKSQERDIIGPIMKQATSTSDPVRRAALAQLAASARVSYLDMVGMMSRCQQAMRERRYQPGPSLPREEVQQTLAMLDRMIALYRELKEAPPQKARDAAPSRGQAARRASCDAAS